MSSNTRRVFSKSFGAAETPTAPDKPPAQEPNLFTREEVDELLPNLGTPETFAQAVTQDPNKAFRLLHSALGYKIRDLATYQERFTMLPPLTDHSRINHIQSNHSQIRPSSTSFKGRQKILAN